VSVESLLEEFEAAGIQLWVDGDTEAGQLRFRAPKGAMSSERRSALVEARDEVRRFLLDRTVALSGAAVVPQPESAHEPFPLTDVQSAYLMGRREVFAYGGVGCHGYVEFALGAVAVDRFDAAWRKLIARHGMLRAVLDKTGTQRVREEVPPWRLRVADLRGRDAVHVTAHVSETRSEMSHRVYAPDAWPLFDTRLTLTDQGATWHVSFDLLVADFVSFQILLDELHAYYESPDLELPPLRLGFRDYVHAQRRLEQSPRFERDREYWFQRIDSLPAAPVLPLHPRASSAPPRFRRWKSTLDARAWSAFQTHAARRSTSASCALLAAYAEVLGRWSRQPRFTLDVTLLNRQPIHPDVNRLVGDFTSVELLSVDTTPNDSFAERAFRLQARLWEDLDHQLFSGVAVVRELVRRRKDADVFFPVVFTSALNPSATRPMPGPWTLAGATFGITQTPQVWIDCQVVEGDGALTVQWDVREGVLRDGVVDDMFAAFSALLARLADDEPCWDEREVIGLPAAQLRRRSEANATEVAFEERLLHEAFVEQALREPERTAVVAGERRLGYGELLQRALGVARALRAAGWPPGGLAAVVLEKGWEQVAAVFGILLAGGAYLPVDTGQPRLRRDGMLEASGVTHVLTRSDLAERAGPWPAHVRLLHVDAIGLEPLPVAAPPPLVETTSRAYVIYTSGSTGQPKGVVISHRAAWNTVDDVARRFGVGPGDVALGVAQLGFDLSVFDVFGTLAAGATLVLPEPERRSDPSHWAGLAARERVTLWNSVPAHLQMLRDYLDSPAGSELRGRVRLRLALVSGDWIPVALPDQVRAVIPGVELVSLGGATEAAIWSIAYPIGAVDPSWSSIPYGKPLRNQTLHVLDAAMRPCPEWVVGELFIGGCGVALEYLNDAHKTAERFIIHPASGERLYRTGDLGRFLPDGNIEFLGREDSQVKIRGHRIELAEIESALAAHPGVRAAAVVVDGDRPRRRLAAFFEADPAAAPSCAELRSWLEARLPESMLPARYECLEVIPLTANGKVDRAALSARLARRGQEEKSIDEAPVGELEQEIAECWAEAFELGAVGRHQDFFALGGDSLLAARIAGRLLARSPFFEAIGFDELLAHLLDEATIARFAARLVETSAGGPAEASEPAMLALVASAGAGPAHVLVRDRAGAPVAREGLAAALGQYGPVWSLAAPSAPTLAAGASLERAVARAAGELAAARIERPLLFGWGAGAAFALELARQLLERGVAAPRLTLLAGLADTEWSSRDAYAGDVVVVAPEDGSADDELRALAEACLGRLQVLRHPGRLDAWLQGEGAEALAAALSSKPGPER
jgi:pyochelin synthetase